MKEITVKKPKTVTTKTKTNTSKTIKEDGVIGDTEFINKTQEDKYEFAANETSKLVKRQKGQIINFEQLNNLLMQNVAKNSNRAFNQYTKELVQSYLQSPMNNLDNLRSVSQFLWRVSASYRKIIEYTALMPLYYYNITYKSDWLKGVDYNKFMKSFLELSGRLQNWNMQELGSTVTATALRDGICVAMIYDNEDDGVFFQYLDPKYCKIAGTSNEGNYVVKFNAAFFDSGNNKDFLYGVNEDGIGVWDDVFISGYETYKSDGRDYQWFELPIDRTLCVIAGDDPTMPLPYYITIFNDLLDILDFQSIVRSKTELQNFILLYSKIPLIEGSDDVDDFALDIDTVQNFQSLIDSVLPDLVGSAYGAAELEAITFKDVNNTEDTDIVSRSMYNLFSKVGISEMLFNSDKGGSVGLDASIKTDEAFALRYMFRIQNWISSYIKNQITDEYIFKFHPVTKFNQKAYVEMLSAQVAFGVPKHLDWATACGTTPYEVMNQTFMNQAIDFNSLWIPPNSAWTTPGDSEGGGQEKDSDELSDEGQKTRDKNKNKKTADV